MNLMAILSAIPGVNPMALHGIFRDGRILLLDGKSAGKSGYDEGCTEQPKTCQEMFLFYNSSVIKCGLF